MRHADAQAKRDPACQSRIDRVEHRRIAREIDHHARPRRGERIDRVIGQHGVVQSGLLDKGEVGGRGQPDPLYPRAPVAQPIGGAERGLARRAGQHDARRAVESRAPQRILDQEAGQEQRLEQHPQRLALGRRRQLGGEATILVIDRAHRLAMRRHVAEQTGADLPRRDEQMRRHRQEAIDAFADRDLGAARRDDARKAPGRHHAPPLRGREEIPIADARAHHRVGHGIGGQRDRLDLQQDLAIARLRRERLVHRQPVERIAAYQHLALDRHRGRSGLVGVSSAHHAGRSAARPALYRDRNGIRDMQRGRPAACGTLRRLPGVRQPWRHRRGQPLPHDHRDEPRAIQLFEVLMHRSDRVARRERGQLELRIDLVLQMHGVGRKGHPASVADRD